MMAGFESRIVTRNSRDGLEDRIDCDPPKDEAREGGNLVRHVRSDIPFSRTWSMGSFPESSRDVSSTRRRFNNRFSDSAVATVPDQGSFVICEHNTRLCADWTA